MFRSQLFWRLYTNHVLIILVSALIVGVLVSRQVSENGLRDVHQSLAVRAQLLAEIAKPQLLRSSRIDGTKTVQHETLQDRVVHLGNDTDSRLTVIGINGAVIADSKELPQNMDNHGSRPEVIDAREKGFATTSRYSQTLQQQMIYRALRVRDNGRVIGFVRVSLPMALIENKLTQLRLIVVFGAGIAAIAALLLGAFFAKRFSDPLRDMTEVAEAISKGDYQRRIGINRSDEMGKLGEAFNRMARVSEQRMNNIVSDRNRLAMIFTGMVEGVIAVDQNQNIVHINEAAAKLLDISITASINRPIWQQVRAAGIHQALENALETGGVVKTQMRSSTDVGAQVVDIYAAALGDDNAESIGAVVVLNDISDLDHLERIRHDFVANASHELKTPITAIRGMTETILDDADMPASMRQSFVEKIHGQSLRLSALVTDLMVISRFDGAHKEQHFQPLDLKKQVQRSVADMQQLSHEKNIELEMEFPEDSMQINGDQQAISQLVDNLLSNAIQYTPAGGVISLQLSRDGNIAELVVQDTGIGISAQYQQRVFERFYRVDAARSRDLGGTGLGLSIVKNIAEQHGGSVSLTSQLGVGSSFKVLLPLI